MSLRIPQSAIILALTVALSFAVIRYFTYAPTPTVRLHTVGGGTVEARVANTRVGTVKACRRSLLAPAIGGEVASLNVREGDSVEQGQILLEIWNEDNKARLELARVQLEAAEARVREACSMAKGAQRESTRLEKLLEDRLVSEEIADQSRTEAEARQASCEAARSNARVSQAQIAVEQSNLERTIVRAPYDGVIAEVNAELGGYVTPSPPGIPTLPAIDLLDMSCMYITAPIDEVDAPPIRLDMPACVSLDAFPEKRCNAYVRRVSSYVLDTEKQARTVEVEIALDDPADLRGLLPGYSADIEILLESREAKVRIPATAIREGNQVLVFDEITGQLSPREITTGISNWEYIEVLNGLQPGERILASAGESGIEPGQRVLPAADSDHSDGE